VAERPAVNASPLIFLASAELLDLLRLAGDEVVVPDVVAEEIKRRGPTDITARALEQTNWLLITESLQIPPIIQAWGLGQGEASVLAWAYGNPGTEAIIAKQRGKITSARSVLDQLRQSGMYLSDRVLNEALTLVGE
jgi:predicted nucleic acid-binding protein